MFRRMCDNEELEISLEMLMSIPEAFQHSPQSLWMELQCNKLVIEQE